jgi:hypothetical protein
MEAEVHVPNIYRIENPVICPVCMVELGFIEVDMSRPYLEGIDGNLIICTGCAGLFIIKVLTPEEAGIKSLITSVRTMLPKEKEALRNHPNAAAFKATQEAIANKLGHG